MAADRKREIILCFEKELFKSEYHNYRIDVITECILVEGQYSV